MPKKNHSAKGIFGKAVLDGYGELILNPNVAVHNVRQGFYGACSARLTKNLIILPIETALLYFITKWVETLRLKKSK